MRMAAALALLPMAVWGQAADSPSWRATVLAEHSELSRGYADWDTVGVQLLHRWSNRQLAEVELTRTRRFGMQDTQLAAGGAFPVNPSLTANLRVTHSPAARVLPRASVGGGLQYEFRPAWLLHGNLGTTRYIDTGVYRASLMLEHYFGDWSALAGVHTARALGQDAHAGELRVTRYYGDASSIGVVASAGDEASLVGPGNVALAKVRSLAAVGQHALGGGWLLRYGAHHVRQGDLYIRRGVTFGVQAAF